MKSVPRIAGAGICCLDHIFAAPQIAWGATASISSYSVQGGGLVATALVACARLGAECEFLSLLGDDQTGDRILSELAEEGIRVQGVQRTVGGTSPFSFIHVDERSGERTIFHKSGAGIRWDLAAADLSVVSGCDVLLIDDVYPHLAEAAARAARESGVPVVADMLPGETNRGLLRSVDVLIAPGHLVGQTVCEPDMQSALEAVHRLGPKTVVVTLGAEGWAYSDAHGFGRGRAFDVDVVDTTGAGDVFHGAFAYGIARGWDRAKSAEFASAVAAIKCTKPGGRTGLPTLGQTMEFLKQKSSRKCVW